MGQHIKNTGTGKRISANGYEATVHYYQAKNCEGCPLRSLCHQAQGNSKIEVESPPQ